MSLYGSLNLSLYTSYDNETCFVGAVIAVYMVVKRKEIVPARVNMCICLYQSVCLQGFCPLKASRKPQPRSSLLTLRLIQIILLVGRYQEQGAKLHFIRYRKTHSDSI